MYLKTIILGLILSFSSYAQEVPAECFEFSKEDQMIIDYSDSESCPRNVIIPGKIDNTTVKYIGPGAFYNSELESVVIPNTIIEISNGAFRACYLKTVEIPDSVIRIGERAFKGNNLSTVKISKSLKVLEEDVFFQNKLIALTIPESVTRIEKGAFMYNNFTSVTIPKSVDSIGEQAFWMLSLETAYLKNRKTKVDSIAFSGNVRIKKDNFFRRIFGM